MIYKPTLAKLAAIAMGLVFAVAQSAGQPPAAAPAQSVWEQPAAALTEQIADAMGPGQVHLTIRNNSTIAADEIPKIRQLLEHDLKARGVTESGAESANAIRVTLSEDWLDGLWVAEVIQGDETRVLMVRAGLVHQNPVLASQKMNVTLRKELLWSPSRSLPLPIFQRAGNEEPILAVLYTDSGLVVMSDEAVRLYRLSFGTWSLAAHHTYSEKATLARDRRAVLIPAADDKSFTAYTGHLQCDNSQIGSGWGVDCHPSDDPWPIAEIPAGASGAGGAAQSATQLKAFYNAARNYFTGVVTPSVGVDLPSFYSAALVPRPGGAGLLIGGIDGKLQIAENGALKTVSGTRDWGSDFAVLHSGCGVGDQVIASGSGEAASDSLRAYELTGLEAVAASAPLATDGTVTALWTAPDGKSVMAVVLHTNGEFEVDRVTALCN
jgi:hypothetical protein